MWLENFFVNTAKCWQAFHCFLQIYSYYNEKLRVDKFFDINSEHIKRINKFWGEIYSENCQLFESFYKFQFTFMYLEKSIFLCESTNSVALISRYNLQSSTSPYGMAPDTRALKTAFFY